MGTKRSGEMIKWRVNVPLETAFRFERIIFNNSRGRSEYGLKSQIITKLIEDYLSKVETPLVTEMEGELSDVG